MSEPVEGRADAPAASRGAGFLRAFLASVAGTGLSRVLGALRDITVARFLGAGAGSDAFWIAFTVPNVFRRFVADEGLTGALVPAVARAENEEGLGAARELASATLTLLLLANLALCLAGWFGAEPLVKAFAYKFIEDPDKFALTVTLTRWMFPFVAFVSLVSFCEGLLNHRGHFFVPKLAPGLVSACIAGSAMLFGTQFERPEYALVVGVLVGGAVHLLVTLAPLLSRWGRVGLSLRFGSPRFRRLARELGKVVLIGIFAELNILVLRQLAAALGDGAITRYWYATRLVDLSQGIVAVGIGSALLPRVSQAVAAGDAEGFREHFGYALRLAAFLLLPVAAVLLGFAEPITAVLFRHGKYTFEDVQWTAATLIVLVPFLLSVAGINIVKKAFFALDDRNSVLAIGAVGVGLTAALGWWLIGRYSIVGLAAALSISVALQLAAYLVVLRFKLGTALGIGRLLAPLLRIAVAAAPCGVLLALIAPLGEWSEGPASLRNLGLLAGGLLGAGALYLVLAWGLRVEELRGLRARFRGQSRSPGPPRAGSPQ